MGELTCATLLLVRMDWMERDSVRGNAEKIIDPRVRATVSKVSVTVILLFFTIVVLIPFFWMFTMSIRTTKAILSKPIALPESLRLTNYIRLFADPRIRFYRYILNSVFVALGSVVITLVLSTLAGYGFGRRRYNFKYREVVFAVLLFALMLPRQVMYIPQYILMSTYKLLNSHLGLILVYVAYALTLSTLLIRTYFSQIPEEFEESARIDGAHDIRIFMQIMLPLAQPVLLTVTLFQFRAFWNELLLAVTFITHQKLRTLPLAMMNFVGENAADYAMAAASLVVGMTPVLLIYIIFAERFIQGLTAGAIKG